MKKQQAMITQIFKLILLQIILSIYFCCLCHGAEDSFSSSVSHEALLSSKPIYEVAVLGAPTTGALIEGQVGAIYKGCRHHFQCHSGGPTYGFIGPQTIAKPLTIKDQPGVFPAPLMGPASLTFTFNCQNSKTFLTPIIVKPDGTVCRGIPMSALDSLQTLVISAPAQTGIYTLFVLAHHRNTQATQVTINTNISTQPQQDKTFYLSPFDPHSQHIELTSAEFIYPPTH